MNRILAPAVTIVVPALDAARTLPACLKSLLLLRQPTGGLDLVVVDNGSRDATRTVAQSLGIRVLREKRRGRSHARNRGLRHARSEFVAFVDADTEVAEDWLEHLLAMLRRNPGLAGAQGPILVREEPDGRMAHLNRFRARLQTQWARRSNLPDELGATALERFRGIPTLDTAACLYRRQALLEVGGFDPQLVRMEDTDLATRVLTAGWGLAVERKALAWNRWGREGWMAYLRARWEDGYCRQRLLMLWSFPVWRRMGFILAPALILRSWAHGRNSTAAAMRLLVTGLEFVGATLSEFVAGFGLRPTRSPNAFPRAELAPAAGNRVVFARDVRVPPDLRFLFLERRVWVLDFGRGTQSPTTTAQSRAFRTLAKLTDHPATTASEQEARAELARFLGSLRPERRHRPGSAS